MERVNTGFFTLEEMLSAPRNTKRRQKMFEALILFAKATYMFDEFSDFHAEQLVYDETRSEWLLLDWMNDHQVWDGKEPAKYADGFKVKLAAA